MEPSEPRPKLTRRALNTLLRGRIVDADHLA